jgi:hypothetical protein
MDKGVKKAIISSRYSKEKNANKTIAKMRGIKLSQKKSFAISMLLETTNTAVKNTTQYDCILLSI